MTTEWFFAAKHGIFDDITKNAGSFANTQDIVGNNFTALMYAAAGNHKRVASYLMDYESTTSTPEGWTALMSAARAGYAQIVELLLRREAGMSTTAAFENFRAGTTALLVAAHYGHTDCVILLAGSAEEMRASSWNPLFLAAYTLQPSDVGLLLNTYKTSVDTYMRTPLMYACMFNRSVAREDLVNTLKPMLGHQEGKHDYYGKTALHYATECNNVEAVRCLVTYSTKEARCNTLFDSRYTALMIACQNGYTDAARILLDHEKRAHNDEGLTALMVAAASSSVECFAMLYPYEASMVTVKPLRHYRAGTTAYDVALYHNSTAILAYIAAHASLSAPQSQSQSLVSCPGAPSVRASPVRAASGRRSSPLAGGASAALDPLLLSSSFSHHSSATPATPVAARSGSASAAEPRAARPTPHAGQTAVTRPKASPEAALISKAQASRGLVSVSSYTVESLTREQSIDRLAHENRNFAAKLIEVQHRHSEAQSALQATVDGLGRERDELRGRERTLQDKLDSATRFLAESQTYMDQAYRENEKLRAQVRELTNRCAQLVAGSERAAGDAQRLRAEKDGLAAEHARLQERCAALAQAAEESAQECAASQAAAQSAAQQHAQQHAQEKAALEGRLAEALARCGVLESRMQGAEEHGDKLQADYDRLFFEHNNALLQAKDLKSDIASLRHEAALAGERLAAITADRDAGLASVAEEQAAARILKARVAELGSALTGRQGAAEAASLDCERLRGELATLTRKLALSTSDAQDLVAQNDACRAQILRYTEELRDREADLLALDKERRQAAEERDELQAAAGQLRRDLAKSQDASAGLARDLGAANALLADLRSAQAQAGEAARRLRAELADAQAARDDLAHAVLIAGKRVAKLEAEARDLATGMDRATAELQDAARARAALVREVGDAKGHAQAAYGENEALEDQLEAAKRAHEETLRNAKASETLLAGTADALREDLRQAEQRAADARAAAAAHEERAAALDARVDALAAEQADAHKALEERAAKLQNASAERDRLRQALQEAQRAVAQRDGDLACLRDDAARRDKAAAVLREQLADQERAADALRRDLAGAKREVGDQDRAVTDAERAIGELRLARTRLEGALAEATAAAAEHKAEAARLADALQKSAASVAQLQAARTALEADAAAARDAGGRQDGVIAALTKQLDARTDEASALTDRVASVTKALAAKQDEVDSGLALRREADAALFEERRRADALAAAKAALEARVAAQALDAEESARAAAALRARAEAAAAEHSQGELALFKMTQERDELEGRCAALSSDLLAAREEAGALRAESSGSALGLKTLQAALGAAAAEKDAADAAAQDFRRQADALRREHDAAGAALLAARADTQAALAEKDALETQLQAARAHVETLTAENKELARKLATQKAAADQAAFEKDNLSKALRQARNAAQMARAEAESLEGRAASLTKKVDELYAQNAALSKDLHAKRAECDALDAARAALQSKHDYLSASYEDTMAEYREVKDTGAELVAQVRELLGQKTDLERRVEQLAGESAEGARTLEERTRALERVRLDAERADQALRDANALNTTLSGENKALHEAVAEAKRRLKRLATDRDALKLDLLSADKFRDQIREMNETMDAFAASYASTINKYADVLSSHHDYEKFMTRYRRYYNDKDLLTDSRVRRFLDNNKRMHGEMQTLAKEVERLRTFTDFLKAELIRAEAWSEEDIRMRLSALRDQAAPLRLSNPSAKQ